MASSPKQVSQYLGFRVSGLGLKVLGLGFRVTGLRVWGLEFRVQDVGPFLSTDGDPDRPKNV